MTKNNTDKLREEMREIGFGNQAIIPGGKYGAKRVELYDFVQSKIKEAKREEREEIKETLRPSLDKLTPALMVNDKWAKSHQEFGGEVIFDNPTPDIGSPHLRPIKVVYYSPLRDLQEAIKAGGKLQSLEK